MLISISSALFGGQIEGIGPRYCPSIEDKVNQVRRQGETSDVFVEPEGLDTDEMYIQGMSSSLPEDVQDAFYTGRFRDLRTSVLSDLPMP